MAKRFNFPKIVFFLLLCLGAYLGREIILGSIGSFLVVQDELKPADVIVVLGGGTDRVDEAVRLYKKGLAGFVIMSGGAEQNRVSLAGLMRRQAVRMGVPQDRVLLEPKAMSTFQHPGLVKALMRQHGFKSAIVVSSPYHMRRSAILFGYVFWRSGIRLAFYPSQNSSFRVHGWWKNPVSRHEVGTEYLKMTVNIFGPRVSQWVWEKMKKGA